MSGPVHSGVVALTYSVCSLGVATTWTLMPDCHLHSVLARVSTRLIS